MESFIFGLLVLRIMLSVIGVLGNTVLIVSILQMTRLKTFEVFLLGLAVSNLEEIMIVDIYDMIVLRSTHSISILSCGVLKFMTLSGEVASIFFTVLISIYRYQKLHNAAMRIITPIFMDSMKIGVGLSLLCVLVAVLASVPTYIINLDSWHHMYNSTITDCPADFFQCPRDNCPILNNIYRFLFIFFCYLIPLVIVTGTSSLIIRILMIQQKVAELHHNSEPATIAANNDHHHHHHNHHHHHDNHHHHHDHHHHDHTNVFHRSTIGILAAMMIFQVYCILYLARHLAFNLYDFPAWSELEFFIATFYTALIPYVYGMGHNFFSLKHFRRQ
ncbi:trissin receptor-like [Astyanax mexicanus]|uniref:Trissin receptor-like n=1 Tax=Astyanax mexicanus TaxID=7994 RepID=A0A8T2MEK1_ASTMX|nr:trissin receptor-like [Astyanax mexicanus]